MKFPLVTRSTHEREIASREDQVDALIDALVETLADNRVTKQSLRAVIERATKVEQELKSEKSLNSVLKHSFPHQLCFHTPVFLPSRTWIEGNYDYQFDQMVYCLGIPAFQIQFKADIKSMLQWGKGIENVAGAVAAKFGHDYGKAVEKLVLDLITKELTK